MEGIDYSSIFTGAKTEIFSGISTAAPIAGIVFGAIIAIGIGVKVFSKLAKKG